MSENSDKESKTENASEKRRSDAIEKGNLPFSSEAVTLGSLVAILTGMSLVSPKIVTEFSSLLEVSLGNSDQQLTDTHLDVENLLFSFGTTAGFLLLPLLVIVALGGIMGAIGQNVPQASIERIAPKSNRISPSANFDRIFGKQAWFEFLKMLVKFFVVTIVAYYIVRLQVGGAVFAGLSEPSGIPAQLRAITISMLVPFCLTALVIAIVDLVIVRLKWSKDLMMSRQELKDEMKQSEGDPHIKQRFKMLGRRRLNHRMMGNVPKATVVVVNPTHFAVAMRYVPIEGGAPVVIAKGLDHLALRIRERCSELQIPVVENKPLAQSLHKSTEVGSVIPVELYRAVAEVIHYVEMRKNLHALKN
jgi:flagellar biosynthesis protein FlhB